MERGRISRRDLIRRAGAAALALPLGGALAGCEFESPSALAKGDLLERMKAAGVAKVAIGNEPPYTKIETDGSTSGVEPDVARAVLERLGIDRVEGVIVPYESMIPGLKARRWDMITAGLFMKRSRCAEIAYSNPVLVSPESFVVEKGNPKTLLKIDDVKRNDVKVAVIGGGFEDGILKTAEIPESKMLKVPEARSGIESLAAGRADAFLLPTLSLGQLGIDKGRYEITPYIPDAPKTGSGAGFRKSDRRFVARYNAELDRFKATPEYARILRQWGFDPEAVKGVTTAELCRSEG